MNAANEPVMSTDLSYEPLSRREPVDHTASPTPTPHHRRKAFSTFMKHLARLKTSHHHHNPSSSPTSNGFPNGKPRGNGHANGYTTTTLRKSTSASNNTPSRRAGKHRSSSQPPCHVSDLSEIGQTKHQTSPSTSSHGSSKDNPNKPKPSNQTITTTATSIHSPSAWSSPAPSVRSLTTTLTTITTTAPHLTYNPHPSHHHNPNAPPVLYNNPLSSPSHLHPSGNSNQIGGQIYYSNAVANGLLTDNASIITLASSSKRRRRHSFDTDASIRALPPASLWGGSRESLPLSVLSSNFENRNERASLYGRLGGDTSSVKGMNSPGFTGPGNVGNEGYFFPPASPREANAGNRESIGGAPAGFRSRGSSAWGEVYVDVDEARSYRTASVHSGRTGREEGHGDEDGVVPHGEETESSDCTQHPLRRNSVSMGGPPCLNKKVE